MAKTNADIEHWDVESEEFWEREGKKVASRNLWISIPSLLMGFAIWLMWGMITTQMKNLGFSFTVEQLFTLTAIAGLSGATLRIPASFMIKIAGGSQYRFSDHGIADDPGVRHRCRPDESRHTVHRVPGAGAAVRYWRR